MEITPVQNYGLWGAKREDVACFIGHDRPSGAKVRQYMAMAAKHPKGTPMVVGCSAHSAQQIYIADAAARAGAPGYVFVPQRIGMTSATKWASEMGASIHFVRPGHPSVYRARAKEWAKTLGGCIRWDTNLAVTDTAEQCRNLPDWCRQVVVPTGSGLTAAGVLVGLAKLNRFDVTVVAICVSEMATHEGIFKATEKAHNGTLPKLVIERHRWKYSDPMPGQMLPTGDQLDPYYAAKALSAIMPGDVLWVSGRRPQGL